MGKAAGLGGFEDDVNKYGAQTAYDVGQTERAFENDKICMMLKFCKITWSGHIIQKAFANMFHIIVPKLFFSFTQISKYLLRIKDFCVKLKSA